MIQLNLQSWLRDIDLNTFKKVLTDCLAVKKHENLLIVGDYGKPSRYISPILTYAYAKAARELGLDYKVAFQHSKVRGDSADAVMERTFRNLPPKSVIIINMSGRIGSLDSVGLSFRKFCTDNKHRFLSASSLASISNSKIKSLIDTYNIDYDKLQERADRLKAKLDSAREIHVRTKKGTDLVMNVQGMKALAATGVYRTLGKGGNLPGGEVYLPPKKNEVNGKIVIDGSSRTRKGTNLLKNPIILHVEKGEVVRMNQSYEAKELENSMKWAHRTAKHPWGVRRIAELGIGINPRAKIIGCTVVDEKTLGTAHFAIGSNAWFGGSIYAIIHLDQVFKDPIIKVDGRLLKY
ncbi:MAG: aminopeptidase [archaeon]